MAVPQYSQTEYFNDAGQCFGDDAVLYSNLVDGLNSNSHPEDVNCTTNDIDIAEATVTKVNGADFGSQDSWECNEGDFIDLDMEAILDQNANSAREDIGIWIATDGGNAITGACNHYNLIPGAPGTFNDDTDQCAGMAVGASTSVPFTDEGPLHVPCVDNNNDGFLDIGACIGWKIPGANEACADDRAEDGDPQTASDFRAGTLLANKSKCNCTAFQVPITILQTAKLEVKKVCDPTSDAGKFDLLIDGSNQYADDAACGGTTGSQTVSAGSTADPGATHTVGEAAGTGTDLADYASSISCVDRGETTFDGGSALTATGVGPLDVAVDPDDDIVCTVTNRLKQGSLTLVKRIVNDNGGSKVVGDFGITSNAGSLTFGAGAADGTNTLKYTSNKLSVAPGPYTFSESDVGGYTEGTWSCSPTSATTSAFDGGSVTVGDQVDVTCTITNDDDAGSLTLIKRIVNANGGTKVVGDFGITTDAGSLTFGAGAADGANTLKYTSNKLTVDAGPYTFSESDVTGYTEGSWSCSPTAATTSAFDGGSVSVGNGVDVTCTITNSDQASSLTLVKRIVNDDGGTKVVGDFGITTDAGSLTFGAGSADGANTLKYTSNKLAVSAGSYNFSENDVTGYTEGTWSCSPTSATTSAFDGGSVTIGNGVDVTCTITNDDDAGSLTLIKRIVNDNGGTKVVGDFGITTDAGSLSFGAGAADGANTLKYTSNKLTVDAGSYNFSENDVSGYSEGTWSCSPTSASSSTFDGGSVTVGNGVDVTCTITNDDDAGSLTLVKRIVNDHGGTKVVGDFGITTNAGSLTFGAGAADGANTLKYTSNKLTVNTGTYNFSENDVTGYTEGSWSCSPTAATSSTYSGGSVAVGNGVDVTCTITNDDDAGSLTLVKRIVNDDGGTSVVGDFGITTDAGSLTFGAGSADGANTLKYTSNKLTVSAGSYNFSENDLAFYTEGTWSCSPTSATSSAFDGGSVSIANGVDVTCTITNDDQPRGNGQIAPTQTTCQDFLAGSDPLTQLLAQYKGQTINTVSPGVFFYYATVTKAASQSVGFVEDFQAGEYAGPPDIIYDVHQGQAYLYDLSCNKVADLTLDGGRVVRRILVCRPATTSSV